MIHYESFLYHGQYDTIEEVTPQKEHHNTKHPSQNWTLVQLLTSNLLNWENFAHLHWQILCINQLQKGIIKYYNLSNIQSTTMTKANTFFPNSTPPLTLSIENHVVISQYE